MVAVLGISRSSQADLLSQLDALGTNLLQVQAGNTFAGGASELPPGSEKTVARINPVQQVSSVATVSANGAAQPLRRPRRDERHPGARPPAPDLLTPLAGTMAQGVFLNDATSRLPVAVLGAVAAARLGIANLTSNTAVWLGGKLFRVAGVMASLPLAPDIDRAALIGYPEAARDFGQDGSPTTIYVRADPSYVTQVEGALAPSTNPANPEQVQVSRPSDALAARAAAKGAFTSLLLGLGAVALLVGGVGIANVMVISRARAPLRDRPAPRARRDARARPPPVPRRVAAAARARRRRRRRARRRSSPPATRRARTSRSSSR